jgi:hypothetical protein
VVKLADVNVSELEMRRGWLGMGRDKAEDDPSWATPECRECDGAGFTESAAFMCVDGERAKRCHVCKGTGRR